MPLLDDYTNDTTTTGRLVLAQTDTPVSVTGQIEVADDSDWFAVDLTAGNNYSFTAQGATYFYTAIYDENAIWVAHDAITPTNTGTYYVAIAATIESDYTLTATQYTDEYSNDTSTTATLIIPDTANTSATLTGTLASYEDSDWVAVDLTAGNSYVFGLKGAASWLNLQTVDAGTGELTSIDDYYYGSGSFTPATSGTYYLDITGYQIGDYSVFASQYVDDYANNNSTTGVLAIADTIDTVTSVTGEIGAINDNDWFAVDLTAGNSYSFTVDGNANANNIFDAAGNVVTWSHAFTPTSSATYYVSVSGNYSGLGDYGTGSYTLSANQYLDDYVNNSATTAIIDTPILDNPTSISGSIEVSGDVDWLAVSLTAGNSYSFSVDNSNEYLQIIQPSGEMLTSNVVTPSSSGIYYVAVSYYLDVTQANDYTVKVAQYADDYLDNANTTGYLQTPSLDSTSVATGSFETAGDSDWFAIQLNAGDSYSFSSDAPNIFIQDDANNVVSWLDGGGAFTAKTAGTYYVVAFNAYNSMDSYSIKATQYSDDYSDNATTTGNLPIATTLDTPTFMTGNLEVNNDTDWIAVDLVAGQSYRFSVTEDTTNNPINLNLVNSAGHLSGFDYANGSLFFTAYESAPYYLSVATGGWGSSVGSYTLSATKIDYFNENEFFKDINIIYGDTNINGGIADVLYGMAMTNQLYSGNGEDTLYGGAGDDTLDGGAGSDTMQGDTGNDTYIVDDSNDIIIEISPLDSEIDIVYSAVSYSLGDNVENLSLTGVAGINGTGNELDNTIIGDDGDNVLDGMAGDDILRGNHGNDTLNGGDGNDKLYGLSDSDSLTGGAGKDTLTGGAGADTLEGGAGKDIYNLKESTAASDSIIINAGDSGVKSYDVIKGFALGEDKLDLSINTIAANNAASDGINKGGIASHSISNGIIHFDNINHYSSPLNNDSLKLNAIVNYLQSNIANETVAFSQNNNTYIFQDNGVNDILVQLTGVTASSLDNTGNNTQSIWIV